MYQGRLNRPKTSLRRAFSRPRQRLLTTAYSLAGLLVALTFGTYQSLAILDAKREAALQKVLSIEPAAGDSKNAKQAKDACTPAENAAKEKTRKADCPAKPEP